MPSMEEKPEKRLVRRKNIRQPISFEIGSKESGRFGNVMVKGRGVDICHGGIGLITKWRLEEGNVLKLCLPVAAAHTSLPVFAEVIWMTPVHGRFRAGLRFLA